jgi:tetratricopeptide (TPR) repeat protein
VIQQGICHFELGHYEVALRLFTGCLEYKAWGVYRLLHRRAYALFKLGRFDEALADLALAMKTRTDYVSIITWIPVAEVAACPSDAFRMGLLDLATKAIQSGSAGNGVLLTRAHLFIKMARFEEAERDIEAAAKDAPLDPDKYNNLSWALVSSDDPERRSVPLGLKLARHAVELRPANSGFQNTLGVACYRAQQWTEAIEHLETSIRLNKDVASAFDTFFLAMAHWQLGHQDKAHDWYDKAVVWMQDNRPQDDELLRFRAEADVLLNDKPDATAAQ